MLKITMISIVVLVAALGITEGLKCNEGFNISLGGIPFYHWSERECGANSKCFGQELTATVLADVELVYGSCISSAYADQLDCNTLFGADSTFDPAKLLDLIPEIQTRFEALVGDFVQNGIKDVINLLSDDGKSTESFIGGIFKFYENMGFNMDKMKPLQAPLAKLLKASFNATTDPNAFDTSLVELMTAFDNLNTENTEFATNIYKFLKNFLSQAEIDKLKLSIYIRPVIEKIPQLIKTIWPSSWESGQWYDLVFKVIGDININNTRQSTIDAIATIKSTVTIPSDVQEILDPVFNNLPDLIEELSKGNITYAGTWSLNLLTKYSENTTATDKFEIALIKFIEELTVVPLLDEYKMMIKWMPGLFYKMFPTTDRAAISEAYTKMADGFDSFNFTDIQDTAETTKLSDFIIDFVGNLTGSSVNATEQAFIINFSKMFYNLLSSYTTQLDKFVKVLSDGFVNYPNIDSGLIIIALVEEMGGVVPMEAKPLLEGLQSVIFAAASNPLNATALYTSFTGIINKYKGEFPTSTIPGLVQTYINLVKQLTELGSSSSPATVNDIMMKLTDWQIDLQFAIFNEIDFTGNELTNAIANAFPQYDIYIRAMKAANPEDIKQLIKDITGWISSGDVTSTTFVAATKTTIEKITASLTDVIKDLRALYAPDSCKFGSCATDLCNSHTYISSQEPLTKASTLAPTTPTTGTTATTTTAGTTKASYSFILNIATTWLACKFLIG